MAIEVVVNAKIKVKLLEAYGASSTINDIRTDAKVKALAAVNKAITANPNLSISDPLQVTVVSIEED